MRRFHTLFLGLALLAGCGEDSRARSLDLSVADSTPVDPAADASTPTRDASRPRTTCTQVCDYAGCRQLCEEIPDPVTPIEDPYAN